MSHTADAPMFRAWGFWAVLTGLLALGLVLYVTVGPMFDPRPSAATQVGELAGEMRRAAWRGFFGLKSPEPPPEAPASYDRWLALAGPGLGLLALLLSLISGLRGENRHYVVYGGGLGAVSILFFYLWWMAIAILGVLLLIAIIENIGDIFGGFFGIFGG